MKLELVWGEEPFGKFANSMALGQYPAMKLEVEVELSTKQKSQLSKAFGLRPTDDFEERMRLYANAAAREYVEMFLGERNFTRGSDLREYRLLLLLEIVFKNTIPKDQLVANLFHCTLSQSRALLRSVMARYGHLLEKAVDEELEKILVDAEEVPKTDRFLITVNSESLITELNRMLASADTVHDLVTKELGKAA